MAELLAVPLKKPSDVDVIKPLTNVISTSYSTADKPQDFSDGISEFSKLRNNAVWRVFEKYESSLEVIYNYYDQICALETKIPAQEIPIPFKWKDAFDKGSIFGGRISLTVSSLAYEKVCVLFNIAALQSSVAAAQSLESDEGLKLAAKLFQQAAGIFNHLRGTVMAAIQQEPTPDLSPVTLGALSALMLAQAQEMFVQKAIRDNMKDNIVAKLCSQCEDLYAEALKQLQKELVRPLWDRDWIPTVAGKQAAYHGLTEYFQSLVCKNEKLIGEEIARLTAAVDLFAAAQQRSGKATFFQSHSNKAQRALTEAKKDNDFIYHERIPDIKSLPSVGKAMPAKNLPLPERLSQNFKDLFEDLVPVHVHQSLAGYELKKNEIVNGEIMKLRESTQLLNSILASLNLPAALEDSSGDSVPPSLLEKSEAVRAMGGVANLSTIINDLPQLLQRNTEILDEIERMLRDEKESDDQLREQFKERWSRTPSEKLIETFKTNISKYREIINNAVKADRVVREKFETHRKGMELLSKDPADLRESIPSCGGGSAAQHSSAAYRLRQLMEQVETIKAERDSIEQELKSPAVDMKSKFLAALSQDKSINEQALAMEMIGQSFGPLQNQVRESLQRQESLLAEIQLKNTEFCQEKSGADGAHSREAVMKEIAAAHDAFMELQNNLKEGSKFYNDLTQLLVVFQNKVSDFCFARKTEKEELMKDLTQSLGRQQFGTTPNVPSHHTDEKKTAPPRPPPPSVAPTATAQALPYPMYPQGMPVPYAATAAAPYPTYVPPPMPAGYNPYAAPSPYPQQAYAAYPGYPQQQQQPPPQQQHSYPGYPYQQQPGRPW